jgi:hypothetical protein
MVAAFERTSKRVARAARLSAVAVAACAAILAGGVSTPSALAGQYHVYSCRTPSGEVAPVDGWSDAVATSGRADDYAANTCAEGGALIAALGDQSAHIANVDRATWSFETPLGDSLVAATLWRAGYVHGGSAERATYDLWIAGPEAADVFDECLFSLGCADLGEPGVPISSANRMVVSSPNLGPHLYVNAGCETGLPQGECQGGFGDPNGYAAVVYLYAADLVIEQTASPTSSNVSGELASAPTLAGTSDVAFSASDPGSGVYQAVFSVDGQVVQTTPLDEDGGRCKNVGETTDGLPAFLYLQPCLQAVSVDVPFDTTRLANGAHHLVVSVTDAAGNSATVLDRNVTVDNPPPAAAANEGGPNGTNASSEATLAVAWKTTRRAQLTSVFGASHTIVGRLTGAGGTPIGAARIDVFSTPGYAGAPTAAMPSVLTAANGDFTLRLPAGVSSRTLRFAYSSVVGSPPVATRTLKLSVHAGVALTVAPRTASVGRSIYFSGRLRGGLVPAGGKPLVLEARSPGGGWLEFDVIRSDARGRFHASYRFKFPGPAVYQFRVLCEAEADYPFAAGASKVVWVFER